MDCNDLDKGPVATAENTLLRLNETEQAVLGAMECK